MYDETNLIDSILNDEFETDINVEEPDWYYLHITEDDATERLIMMYEYNS